MKEIDIMAVKAKSDETTMSELISKNESFILRCASSAARNYISKSDSEWSVALGAFTQAVKIYSVDKGSFLNFSELRMRRSIFEFIKNQSVYSDEDLIDFNILNPESTELELGEDIDTNDNCAYISTSISHSVIKEIDNSIKLEIELANNVLFSYGFTFFDLENCSPKSKKAKKGCINVVSYMINNPILISNMKVKKSLQINIIQKNAKISKKALEHYQKYIIAAVEIISGDYRCLSEYFRFIREGLKDEICSC